MNVTVTQILRPVKLAFLLQPNRKGSYMRAVQIASSLWGGKYFPIIPIYKKFTKSYRKEYHLDIRSPIEFYENVFKNFAPDFFVVDDGLDPEYIKSFENNRDIVTMDEIESSILDGQTRYGISITEVLQTVKETEFVHHRTDLLTVCCPKVGTRDLFSMTLCGSINPRLLDQIKKVGFPKEYISFPSINRNNLNRCVGDSILNYLSLGAYKINHYGSPIWSAALTIYIINPDHLNDLINIWNYRALGWNILPIPDNSLNEPYYRDQIEKQQIEFHRHQGLIERINVMANYEIGQERVNDYIEQLSAVQINHENRIEYIHHWWFPRYWEKGEFLGYDRIAAVRLTSSRKQTIISTEDFKIHVPVQKPVFKSIYIQHIKPRYINEIMMDFDETEGKYAQILPELPTKELDYLIRGSGSYQWIFSDGIMIFLAKESDGYLSFFIPQAYEVLKKWFGVHQIQIRHSPSGKLGNQVLKNIRGIYGTNFLANPGIPPVLSHFENGKIVYKESLYAELGKQINQKRFRIKEKSILTAHLLDKKIIEFGANVQCAICNQHSFYKLSDLNERIKCPVCQNTFFIPSHNPNEIKWSYRGMGPFSRNNKADGLLCVLLTLRFFKISMHPGKITPLLSFELLQNNQVVNEVDLAVFYGKEYKSIEPPDLFLSECKTEIDFKDSDVKKMQKLGQLFPGVVLTFATLKPALSNEEKDRIKKLANFFRKGFGPRPINPVLILTGNELLPANPIDPFANIKHHFIDHMRFSDEINHLADVTCQQYLDLPSFESIIHERFQAKIKTWENGAG